MDLLEGACWTGLNCYKMEKQNSFDSQIILLNTFLVPHNNK